MKHKNQGNRRGVLPGTGSSPAERDSLCVVKTTKKDTVIPKGQTVNVTCHANTGPVERRSPVLFELDEQLNWSSGLTVHESLTTVQRGKSSSIDIPVSNTTGHDIILPKHLVLGRLQLVHSAAPLEVHLNNGSAEDQNDSPVENSEINHSTMKSPSSHESVACKVPEVDLSGLTPEKQQQAREMLYQEADAFASHDEDIGCIEQLQMNIKLTDNKPVQKNYLSIPIPLYPEVKVYIEDLLIGSLSGNPHPRTQAV